MAKTDKTAFAVIGAGYGDEGKGLMTDALCAALGPETLVIRHNGGAQAGHTVTLADGRRHVFHHVGSGSFTGCDTGLSRHFISNPYVLAEELTELEAIGVRPHITADERGLLTTLWDMMINRYMEEARGVARHGSCGMGIGETVERSLDPRFATTLADVTGDPDLLRQKFDLIRLEWVPARLTRLGQPQLWLKNRDHILSDDLLEDALENTLRMRELVEIAPKLSAEPGRPIVFEGAQGLMLDQTMGAFPYVTRSNTGLLNILEIATELGLEQITPFYPTRAYVTRHGAGPIAHEQEGPPSALFSDATNQPNPWQGTLRFGTLDVDVLDRAIRADLASVDETRGDIDIAPRLAVTCLDQIDGEAQWIEGGVEKRGSGEALVAALAERLPVSGDPTTSLGPTRDSVELRLDADAKSSRAGEALTKKRISGR